MRPTAEVAAAAGASAPPGNYRVKARPSDTTNPNQPHAWLFSSRISPLSIWNSGHPPAPRIPARAAARWYGARFQRPNTLSLTFRPSPPCGVHMANRITSTAPTVTLFSACERSRQLPPEDLIFLTSLT